MNKTKITTCVLVNFSLLLFPAEGLSFSEEAEATMKKKTGMTVTEKEALCVSIIHIMFIISRLRGLL